MAKNSFLFTLIIITLIFISGCTSSSSDYSTNSENSDGDMTCDDKNYRTNSASEYDKYLEYADEEFNRQTKYGSKSNWYTNQEIYYRGHANACSKWAKECGLDWNDKCGYYERLANQNSDGAKYDPLW